MSSRFLIFVFLICAGVYAQEAISPEEAMRRLREAESQKQTQSNDQRIQLPVSNRFVTEDMLKQLRGYISSQLDVAIKAQQDTIISIAQIDKRGMPVEKQLELKRRRSDAFAFQTRLESLGKQLGMGELDQLLKYHLTSSWATEDRLDYLEQQYPILNQIKTPQSAAALTCSALQTNGSVIKATPIKQDPVDRWKFYCEFQFETKAGLFRRHIGNIELDRTRRYWWPVIVDIDGIESQLFGISNLPSEAHSLSQQPSITDAEKIEYYYPSPDLLPKRPYLQATIPNAPKQHNSP